MSSGQGNLLSRLTPYFSENGRSKYDDKPRGFILTLCMISETPKNLKIIKHPENHMLYP